jgi:transcriptional regulator
MHPDPHYTWHDVAAMRAFVAMRSFGTLFVSTPDGPCVAHVPAVALGEDRLAFHISRSNRIARHLQGARALFVVNGEDGYVSPDWYGIADQVPTWNYVAVEMEGAVALMDEAALITQIDALSAAHEARLAPKPAWTRDKMTPGLAERMVRAIEGFVLTVETWRGTAKLGQNKPEAVRLAAAQGMAATGHETLAAWMLDPRKLAQP